MQERPLVSYNLHWGSLWAPGLLHALCLVWLLGRVTVVLNVLFIQVLSNSWLRYLEMSFTAWWALVTPLLRSRNPRKMEKILNVHKPSSTLCAHCKHIQCIYRRGGVIRSSVLGPHSLVLSCKLRIIYTNYHLHLLSNCTVPGTILKVFLQSSWNCNLERSYLSLRVVQQSQVFREH